MRLPTIVNLFLFLSEKSALAAMFPRVMIQDSGSKGLIQNRREIFGAKVGPGSNIIQVFRYRVQTYLQSELRDSVTTHEISKLVLI